MSVPVYIYHFPARMGNKLGLDTLDQLAEIDGVVGVKDSSGDVGWLGQAIDRNLELTFLAGLDVLLFAELDIGCSGLVSAVSNVFPEVAVELYEAYMNDDDRRARELQSVVFDIWKAIDVGSYLGGVKSALNLHPEVEFQPEPMRSPLRRLDASEEDQLSATMERLGLF